MHKIANPLKNSSKQSPKNSNKLFEEIYLNYLDEFVRSKELLYKLRI